MKKELKIGFFVIIVFIVFFYFIIKTESVTSILSKKNTYSIYAKFSDVSGVYKGAPVRLAGIKIGLVSSIKLERNKAVLKMFIKDKYEITDDARAMVTSIGIVGEKFIEIVYREEFRTKNPKVIENEGELKSVITFDINALSGKLNDITNKVSTVLDSVNDIVSDKYSKESIKVTLANIREITNNLKGLSGKDSKIQGILGNFHTLSLKLKETTDSLSEFVTNLDKSLYNDKDGIVNSLQSASKRIDNISKDLKTIVKEIGEGKGTAGKLIKDEGLYKKIDNSIDSVNSILKEIEKKKDDLSKARFKYNIGIDYFTDYERARFSLGLNLNLNKFVFLTRVNEDPESGDPRFSAMLGKKYGDVSFAGGLVDSELGAAIYFDFFKSKLSFGIEASQFYRQDNPRLKTIISFSLRKNMNLCAGYEDVLNKDQRRFLLGISMSN
jgi:phospholipid/cholesterol/gamma-HCH transport system substrate-binding protein